MQDPIRWFINTLSGGRLFVKDEPKRHFTRAGRHENLGTAFRKRRAKNKVAAKSRRINRKKK